jgi:hypothetical protein
MAVEMIVKANTPKSKGHFRRRGEWIQIQERWRKERSYEAYQAQLEWLLKAGQITMSDGSDPMEALLDLSEEEADALIAQVMGVAEGETVPTKNGS